MKQESRSSEPLAGRRALLASSSLKSGKLRNGLEKLGAKTVVLPVISIVEAADKGPLDAALDRIEDYDWIIFSSAYGVLFFLRRMKERGFSTGRLQGRNICAVGPATAAALEEAAVSVSLVPERFVAEGILSALADRSGGPHGLGGRRILLARALEARDVLPRGLADAGAQVDIAPCYENVLPPADPELLTSIRSSPPDLLVFTSSSTVTNFVALLGRKDGERLLAGAAVAVIGPITAAAVKSFGKTPEILPSENTIPALLAAIEAHFNFKAAV